MDVHAVCCQFYFSEWFHLNKISQKRSAEEIFTYFKFEEIKHRYIFREKSKERGPKRDIFREKKGEKTFFEKT